eukprot:UN20178
MRVNAHPRFSVTKWVRNYGLPFLCFFLFSELNPLRYFCI